MVMMRRTHAGITSPPRSRAAGARALVLAVLCLISLASIAAPPTRIVSTSPSATETLFALGLGDRVVGVSRFCRHPAAVRALPRIGTFLRPDVELIARLRPDLVVIHASHTGVEQRLKTMTIPFVSVERGTLASVYTSIRDVGQAAGVADRATALVADLDRQLDRVRQAVANRPPKRVLIIVGRRVGTLSDLVSAGPGTYLHDLAAIAGGVNVLDDRTLPEYPRISMETVIRLRPDAIVDAGEMGLDASISDPTPAQIRARQQQIEDLWRGQKLIAASGARVFAATDDAFVTPGPRVTDVARQFARWLHGVEVR